MLTIVFVEARPAHTRVAVDQIYTYTFILARIAGTLINICKVKIFKRLLCKPSRSSASSLFVNMNVDNFLVRRRKLIFSLYNKVRQSGNSIIQCIVDSSFFNSCGLKREWDSILHLT